MKYFCYISLVFLLFSCAKTEATITIPDDWTTLTLENGDTFEVPDSFALEELQGIDSYVGKISSPSVEIFFDIGWLAGEYVDSEEDGVTCDQTTTSDYCYKTNETLIIATFPDAGPANFSTPREQVQLFLEIMDTFLDN